MKDKGRGGKGRNDTCFHGEGVKSNEGNEEGTGGQEGERFCKYCQTQRRTDG